MINHGEHCLLGDCICVSALMDKRLSQLQAFLSVIEITCARGLQLVPPVTILMVARDEQKCYILMKCNNYFL